MKRIWAPWRLSYVASCSKQRGCVLCAKVKARDDQKELVLARSRYAYAVLNLYPYTNGHTMIVPYRHVADLAKLTKHELSDMMSLVVSMQKKLQKAFKPHGFNVGINCGSAAGAGIEDHIHMHIVPRWKGDTNFMPVFADTKIIPQSLEDVYVRLTHGSKRRA